MEELKVPFFLSYFLLVLAPSRLKITMYVVVVNAGFVIGPVLSPSYQW